MIVIEKFICNSITITSFISTLRFYHPLFNKFTTRGAAMIFGKGRIIKLNQDQTVFTEGSNAETLYLVLYGKIIMRTINKNIMQVIKPGDSVGEEVLFNCSVRYC